MGKKEISNTAKTKTNSVSLEPVCDNKNVSEAIQETHLR